MNVEQSERGDFQNDEESEQGAKELKMDLTEDDGASLIYMIHAAEASLEEELRGNENVSDETLRESGMELYQTNKDFVEKLKSKIVELGWGKYLKDPSGKFETEKSEE